MIPGGWLGILTIGIILGALGQGARTIVGFKKLNDYTDTSAAVFDGVRLLMSFAIGGVAGALAAVTILSPTDPVNRDQLIGIAAAGYTGADFIEGFISRFTGGGTSTGSNTGAVAPSAASDDAVG